MSRPATLGAALACVLAAACVDREIVRPPAMRTLTTDEVLAGLASPSFRDVLAARAQLRALPDPEWLGAMERLARSESPQKRLLAVLELDTRPVPRARELLGGLADDPDETVRARARERLAAGAPSGGTPCCSSR